MSYLQQSSHICWSTAPGPFLWSQCSALRWRASLVGLPPPCWGQKDQERGKKKSAHVTVCNANAPSYPDPEPQTRGNGGVLSSPQQNGDKRVRCSTSAWWGGDDARALLRQPIPGGEEEPEGDTAPCRPGWESLCSPSLFSPRRQCCWNHRRSCCYAVVHGGYCCC